MRTERQMDMTKLIVVFRNFANAPEKSYYKNEDDQGWSKHVAK
jgi:hypothetical protein